LENKIFTEKRVNYDKLHSKLPILRVNYDKLYSKLPIFRVKSVKIYTGQKKFTRVPPVAPVTNMRYGMAETKEHKSFCGFCLLKTKSLIILNKRHFLAKIFQKNIYLAKFHFGPNSSDHNVVSS